MVKPERETGTPPSQCVGCQSHAILVARIWSVEGGDQSLIGWTRTGLANAEDAVAGEELNDKSFPVLRFVPRRRLQRRGKVAEDNERRPPVYSSIWTDPYL